MAKIPQTREELKKHLRENLAFLNVSNKSFDEGLHAEAKRLATTIRVLVHDTLKSKSLLEQLGVKNDLKFLNTSYEYSPTNLMPHTGLVMMRMTSNGTSYLAPLHDGPPDRYTQPGLEFSQWWDQLVIDDKSGGVFTRKNLILFMANQDGGAHVDPSLDSSYAALKRDNSVGWVYSDGISEHPITDIELHSVRQIAYELIETLKPIDINSL